MPPSCFTRVGTLLESLIPEYSSSLTELLEAVLFAKIRFHDTVSRGRLLNRFGKDFEGNASHVSQRSMWY